MLPLSLRALAEWTNGRLVNATGNEIVTGICTDSRQVKQGNLFTALKGERLNGHGFVADAAQKGATAAMVNRPLDVALPQIVVADTLRALGDIAAHYLHHIRSSIVTRHSLLVIAVTGSSGKTTTKMMIGTVLQAIMPVVISPESYNNEIGVPLTVLQAEPEHRALVLEYAMRQKGDIAYLCRIAPPDIAVITNIGTAHIGLLGSRQAIAETKAEILAWDMGQGALGKGHGARDTGQDFASMAVLPADDDFAVFLRQRAKGDVITFGFSPNADVRGLYCKVDWDGTILAATDGKRGVSLRLPILGEHNAYNALAALAVAKVLNIDWVVAAKVLENFAPPKMRLQRQWLEQPGCWVINDAYNANPDSVKAALQVMQALPAKRKVSVLGEMLELGESHEQWHQEIGKVAAAIVDLLIVIGDGAKPIADGASAIGMPTDYIICFSNLDEAKEKWRSLLQPDDLVLLKASRAVGLERLL